MKFINVSLKNIFLKIVVFCFGVCILNTNYNFISDGKLILVIILVICSFILLFHQDKLKNYYLKHKKICLSIMLLISIALTYYLIGQNLNAKWSIIDDHEIMYFLGPT